MVVVVAKIQAIARTRFVFALSVDAWLAVVNASAAHSMRLTCSRPSVFIILKYSTTPSRSMGLRLSAAIIICVAR